MIEIGRQNHLRVVKTVDFGVYLDGEHLGEILLPSRYVPDDCEPDGWVDVFLYADSDDLLIATTETPKVMVRECAYLKVVEVNDVGAFLDWGLPKDLLVPYNEQHRPVSVGTHETVYVYLDPRTDRIAASSWLSKHLSEFNTSFTPRQSVDLLICGKSELGYKAVINNTHLGVIYHNEIFQPINYGQRLSGYIKHIRDDDKIDLCLQLQDQQTRNDLASEIIAHLKKNDGISTITDKSSPDEIYQLFKVSKKNYKKALGGLYRQKRILIEPTKIQLL